MNHAAPPEVSAALDRRLVGVCLAHSPGLLLSTPVINDLPPAPQPIAAGERCLRELPPASTNAIEGVEHTIDRTFAVQQVRIAKGVYLHPLDARSAARAVNELDGNYTRLTCGDGVSDQNFRNSFSPRTFVITRDGHGLWKSKVLQDCGNGQTFDVELGGIQELSLKVVCEGSHTGTHGAWLDPILLKVKSENISRESSPPYRRTGSAGLSR